MNQLRKLYRWGTLGLASLSALVYAGIAGATTYDLSPATDAVSNQFSSTLTIVLPIAGALLAVVIAWRFLRRVVKA